jgi:putative colanic acid biosysnthesis UDP-glucose lipid carrier transferase
MSHSSPLVSLAEPGPAVGTGAPPAVARGPLAGSTRYRFRKAPQSVSGFVAALLEPLVSVAVLPIAHFVNEVPFTRASLALLLIVMVIGFPGPDRFRDPPLAAALDICISWFTLLAMLLLCGVVTNTLELYDPHVLIGWALAAPAVHWGLVWLGHDILRRRSARPQAMRAAIVVGAGPIAVTLARALEDRHEVRTRVAGYFDDRSGERIAPEAARLRIGGLADVADYVRRHSIAEVYISLPLGSQPRIVALLESLQGTTASLYLVPDLFGISVIQGRLQDVNGVPIVGLCETPFTGVNEAVKRASDVAIATLVLLLTAPLMLLLALGVRLSSPGPIVFKQRRNGLGGEEIVVYKFRTMRVSDDGPVVRQARPGDPRITPFGAFLRRTSLDELPQFINVLQGRMSIVGPRPHAVAHNEQYAQLIKAYMVRHKVRPGITGWAQVNGHRGETDTVDKMRARVECDLDYLRNWSLGLDLHIILRTIKLIVADRHAY